MVERTGMGVGERFLGLVHIGAVERHGREREPHREQMQRHRLPADHRVELAPIDLALSARQPGLRDEHLDRCADLGRDLSADPGDHDTALRFGDQHALLFGKTVTDPGRSVTLLSRRVTISDEHVADPAMPHPRHRRPPLRGLARRGFRRAQRSTHLTAMHTEPDSQRPHTQPLITMSETDLLVQLHLGQSLSPHLGNTESKVRIRGPGGANSDRADSGGRRYTRR